LQLTLHINAWVKVLAVVDLQLHTTSLAQVEECPAAAAAVADEVEAAEAVTLPRQRKAGTFLHSASPGTCSYRC
jgi:hypothetical protein